MGKEYEGVVTLASKGIFYGDSIPGGDVSCTAMSSEEERILLSPKISYNDTLDRIISKCTNCPIPPGKLLLSDRQQLFYFLRCLSWGNTYRVPFKCSECDQANFEIIDLEKDIKIVYIDDDSILESLGVGDINAVSEPFEFTLPIRGTRIGWRMLRGDDERAVDKYVSRMMKSDKAKDGRPDYIYRQALRIVSIDGQEVKLIDALDLFPLKGKDSLEYREQVSKINIGMDTELDLNCKGCGFPNEVILPMDKSFFRPPRRTA